MRKIAFLLLTLVLSVSASAFECVTSKEIYLPHWLKQTSSNYVIYITNVSDELINIELTFFDSSGNEYSEASESGVNFSIDESFITNPVVAPASLASGNTGRVRILPNGSRVLGNGKIKWSSEKCLGKAVQASAIYFTNEHMSWIQINGGEPF